MPETPDIDTVNKEIKSIPLDSADALEAFRLKYLSRKGIITELLASIGKADPADRSRLGSELNALKNLAKSRFDEAERDYRDREVATKLHSAVKKWERGLNTLARYEKRPNIFDETILKLEKAKEEMHQKYKGKKESCERALKQKDLANAKRYLNDITKSIIPDGRDLRYQWANQKLDSLNSLR